MSMKIIISAIHNKVFELERLLEKGGDVNFIEPINRKTALHRAVEAGHHKAVTVLIKAGANLNVADKYGNTPLHYAAYKIHYIGYEKAVETAMALLDGGADVNIKNNAGEIAFDVSPQCCECAGLLKTREDNIAQLNVVTHQPGSAVDNPDLFSVEWPQERG